MAINKKLISFATQAQFDLKLNAGDIDNRSIVFIEDKKRIWTHGVYFDTSWNYVTGTPDTLAGYNITDAASKINSLYYVVGNTTGTAGAWVGSVSEVTSLYEGLTIAYRIGVAGASTTNLNLNGLGNKLVRRATGNLTTHLPVGTIVLLTYDGTNWVWADYDSNTTYAAMPVAEGVAGTAVTLRTIRADYLKQIIEHHITNTVPSSHILGSHSDVTITSNSDGEILRWNGTNWINNTLAEAGIASTGQLNNYLPLAGGTLTGSSYNILELKRSSANGSSILFSNSSVNLGKIGFISGGNLIIGTGTTTDGIADMLSITPSGVVQFYGNISTSGLITGTGFSKTGATDAHVLLGSGGHKSISDFNTSLVTSTVATGISNVATSNTNTYLNIVQGGASIGSSTRITGSGSVTVSSDVNGVLTINGVNTTYTTGTLAQLNAGADTTGQLHTAKLLNDWLNPKLALKATPADISTAIDGIEIGGVNLLLKSKAPKTSTAYSIGTWTSSRDFIVGETLTVTIKGNIPGTRLFGLWFNTGSLGTGSITKVKDGYYSKQLVVPSGVSTRVIGIYLIGNQSALDSWEFEWIKLESGNKATDWSPAPEDQVSDWSETDVNSFAFLKNKPTQLSQFTNNLGNYGNWVTKAQTDGWYDAKGHTHNYLPLSGGDIKRTFAGWPNAINSDASNYNNQRIFGITTAQNTLHFFGDGNMNARRFGIQSGHESPVYASTYGILELNPFGGVVRINGITAATVNSNVASATKLASITTTFTGTYPVTFNVNGDIYSHTGITYTGSTNTLTATNFVGALSGTVSATTGSFSNTLRLTKNTPSGTAYGALAMEVYSSGGHPVGIGFHRGGYTQTILSHEGSGLVVRTSTISTGALAPITASSFIGKATSADTADTADNATKWASQGYSATQLTTTPTYLMGYDGSNWRPLSNNIYEPTVSSYSFTKSLQLSTTWQDTGIGYNDIPTGTYAFSVYSNNYSVGGGNYTSTFSGVISWYSGGTNSTTSTKSEEIIMQGSGHHVQNHIYIRTSHSVSSSGTNLRLQIATDVNTSAASSYTFNFKQII